MYELKEKIFKIKSTEDFNDLALKIFRYQYSGNTLYKDFVDLLSIDINKVEHYSNIPFLPVSFFKTHKILTHEADPEITFLSSGTGYGTQSRHHVTNVNLYEESFRNSFNHFYGDIEQYSIFALLPSYLEREGSSLIYMVNDLIEQSGNEGGFYLDNTNELLEDLNKAAVKKTKIILFGVSYALLDLARKHKINTPDLTVMETGGMKGRRKEMIREDLHSELKSRFNVDSIHSEYGMTELLSQAYSCSDGIFHSPPWMKVMISDINDPLTIVNYGQSGGINIIDLANINSCSFLATQDLGKAYENGSFEVLGRFDYSDIRGCNLLI
jgi:phenylacetate-coenzyme A ligase PaaK-like adenylate-forming protein